MNPDPTTEIQRIKHELGAEVNFDLDRMFARLRERQEASGRVYVRRAGRTPVRHTPTRRSSAVEAADTLAAVG